MQRIAVAVLCCFTVVAVGQNDGDLWVKYQDDLKANPRSSITRFRIGEIYWQQGKYLDAGNAFREALNGNLEPRWIEAWSHLNLGKIFDVTGQRARAINEYSQVKRLNDNARGALDEAILYLRYPYPGKL